jgi:hypothetical protein
VRDAKTRAMRHHYLQPLLSCMTSTLRQVDQGRDCNQLRDHRFLIDVYIMSWSRGSNLSNFIAQESQMSLPASSNSWRRRTRS